MFRNSPSLLISGRYLNREPHFPYKKSKAWYKFKFGVDVRTKPQLNKDDPLEWMNPVTARMGREWYHKHTRSHSFIGWPYISWRNDPIRHHKDSRVATRTLSKKMELSGNAGYPLWDHYEEAGIDYHLPNDAKTSAVLPFITIHAGSNWSQESVTNFLDAIEKKFPTVEVVSTDPEAVRAWRDSTVEGNKVSPGFIEHLILCCRDVLRNNSKKDFRRLLHSKGYLRTNDMTRYYALPYVKDGSPVMPEKLEQPEGREFQGDYVWLTQEASENIHRNFKPAHTRQSFYDA